MAVQQEQTVQQLFKRWRGTADAQAGAEMAQRFSDWYYAITTARLGAEQGHGPLQRACQKFAEGITQVARSGDLVEWAHDIVNREVNEAGGRIAGGDFPNGLTGGRSPTELLAEARDQLPARQVELLALAYDASVDLDTLTQQAEEAGGMPFALLEARYAVKRWLRDHAGVAFEVVPGHPDLDRAPIPLYEAGRMQENEEACFERWLIEDLDLCKDIAEFATFAHALRKGAFRGREASSPAPRRSIRASGRHSALPSSSERTDEPKKSPKALLIAAVAVAILAGVAVIGLIALGVVSSVFQG